MSVYANPNTCSPLLFCKIILQLLFLFERYSLGLVLQSLFIFSDFLFKCFYRNLCRTKKKKKTTVRGAQFHVAKYIAFRNRVGLVCFKL